MTDVMYEVPSDESIKECIITKESVLDGDEPRILGEDNKEKKLPVKNNAEDEIA